MAHSKAYIAWTKVGKAISNHMVLIIPICLVCGIFLPQVFSHLKPFIPYMFAFMTFQGSLANDFAHLKKAVAHPLPILATLAFVHLVVPVLACLVGNLFFGYDQDIVAGIVLEYCVPVGTAVIMWASIYEGSIAITVTIILVSALIAPVSIPATMHLLTGASVAVDTFGIVKDMVLMVALPSAAAMLFNQFTKGWGAEKLMPVLAPAARIVLPLIVVTNTTAVSAYVLNMTPELLEIMIFIGIFAIFNFTIGIGLGKLFHFNYEQFVPVVFGCGMRNITAGAVIAMQYFPPATLFPVMVAVLYQQLLAAAFGKVMKRILKKMPRE